MIHWPGISGISPKNSTNAQVRAETWKHLVQAKKEGLVRSIGVSNYTVKHLNELLANNFGVKPDLNQVCVILHMLCVKILKRSKNGLIVYKLYF